MLKLMEYLKKKKRFKIKAFGISMGPVLRSNDIIYYKTIPFSRCNINDIIIIQKNKIIFTHRIIYKTKEYLISKGDNSYHSDGRIYPKQIIGKVYQVKRNGQIISPDSLYLLQSTNYFQEIVKIKKALEMEKIEHVFLKGLPLHLYYEKSHPRRIYADCDVLVNFTKIEKINDILIKLGYRKTSSTLSNIHSLLRRKQIEQSYYKLINSITVIFDVHYEIDWMSQQIGKLNELYPQTLINKLTSEFLSNKRKISENKEKFFILNSDFLVIYLALHIFHHNFRGAFRYDFLRCVIANVVKQSCIPRGLLRRQNNKTPCNDIWMEMSENINKYSLKNFVYPVFILLKKYYQTPLPKKFLDSIMPDERKMKYIRQNIMKINIFDDETRIQAGVTRFKNLFFLSPNPFWKKLMIVFNLQVVYSVVWVIYKLFKKKGK